MSANLSYISRGLGGLEDGITRILEAGYTDYREFIPAVAQLLPHLRTIRNGHLDAAETMSKHFQPKPDDIENIKATIDFIVLVNGLEGLVDFSEFPETRREPRNVTALLASVIEHRPSAAFVVILSGDGNIFERVKPSLPVIQHAQGKR